MSRHLWTLVVFLLVSQQIVQVACLEDTKILEDNKGIMQTTPWSHHGASYTSYHVKRGGHRFSLLLTGTEGTVGTLLPICELCVKRELRLSSQSVRIEIKSWVIENTVGRWKGEGWAHAYLRWFLILINNLGLSPNQWHLHWKINILPLVNFEKEHKHSPRSPWPN